jgi:hypothetical protein
MVLLDDGLCMHHEGAGVAAHRAHESIACRDGCWLVLEQGVHAVARDARVDVADPCCAHVFTHVSFAVGQQPVDSLLVASPGVARKVATHRARGRLALLGFAFATIALRLVLVFLVVLGVVL